MDSRWSGRTLWQSMTPSSEHNNRLVRRSSGAALKVTWTYRLTRSLRRTNKHPCPTLFVEPSSPNLPLSLYQSFLSPSSSKQRFHIVLTPATLVCTVQLTLPLVHHSPEFSHHLSASTIAPARIYYFRRTATPVQAYYVPFYVTVATRTSINYVPGGLRICSHQTYSSPLHFKHTSVVSCPNLSEPLHCRFQNFGRMSISIR